MTIFAIVRPAKRKVETLSADDIVRAYELAGLKRLEVDHGVALAATDDRPGVGIVVYEYGLFVSPLDQSYFALGGRLYAGNAVLYGFDQFGETVDLPSSVGIGPLWFDDATDVEDGIAAGVVQRPQMTLNGVTLWQWPDVAPGMFR